MFVFLEPRILLLGIDPAEIIRGTDQDLGARKLITGLFIPWKKLETTGRANSLGRRKHITNSQDNPCNRPVSSPCGLCFWRALHDRDWRSPHNVVE